MYHANIGLALHLDPLTGGLRFRADDSQEFAAFGTCISNLGLKWNLLEVFNVYLHELQVLLIPNFILEGYLGVHSGVGELLH
jgi:hypothetical protein